MLQQIGVRLVGRFLGAEDGRAHFANDLAIEAEPLEPFTFSPAGLSVYQLGNNGTAAKQLESFAL